MSTTIETDITRKAFWAQHQDIRDEVFTRLRAESPVLWTGPAESDLLPPEENLRGFWSLTKYEDIQFASRHPAIFSSSRGITMEDFPPQMTEIAQSFIAMDAPRHTQLRGITMDAFKPGNMRKLETWIQGHAKDLVDEMAHLGQGDIVELISEPMPGRIFGSFFGLHPGHHAETIRAAQDLLSWNDPDVCGDLEPLELFANCVMTLRLTAAELAEERRADPGDDLMTWLVQAEFEGERMTDDEIGAFFVLLAVAANDTSRHASAAMVHLLTARFTEQRDLLLEDLPGRAEGAVEEVLRWVSPLIHMRRTALQDCEVRGQQIRAGDKVVLWYCSGNRDEEYWGDPFAFDIFRSPNRHQAFGGGGPHYCLGAALARRTLRSLLIELFTRIPDLSAPEPDFLVANFINGIKRLPATWTPVPQEAPAAG